MSEKNEKAFLRRALGKLSRFDRDQWTGYLTSAEIVALAEAGIQVRDDRQVQRSRELVAAGKSVSTWFYFKPIGSLLEAIRKAHPKEFS